MNFTPKEERIIATLYRMEAECSDGDPNVYPNAAHRKFVIRTFAERFYFKKGKPEERPDNWRSSMIASLRTLELKLKGSGSHVKKVSGRGRGIEAAYEFKLKEGLLDE